MNAMSVQLEVVKTVQPGPVSERPVLTERPARVVVVRQDGVAHGAATAWARSLAAAVRGDVVVVRQMSPRGSRVAMLRPQVSPADGLQQTGAALRLMDARLRWMRRFPESGEAPFVSIEQSGLSDLASTLKTLEPVLVVVPASAAWGGDRVARLALEVGVPVLAARRPGGAGVLAASSLSRATLPVLKAGAWFARALQRPLTVAHNLGAQCSDSIEGANATELAALEQAVAMRLVRQLEHAARDLAADVDVTRSDDTALGIVSAAQRADAGVLVVGCEVARSQTQHRISARVVDDATRRSVLVVPLPGEGPASSAEAPRTEGELS